MRIFQIIVWMPLLLLAVAAQAQTRVDVAKISCDQFLFDKIAPSKSIAVWLSGYYNGLEHNTVIDMNRMDVNIDKVEDYCRLHRDMGLMDAAKNALGVGK